MMIQIDTKVLKQAGVVHNIKQMKALLYSVCMAHNWMCIVIIVIVNRDAKNSISCYIPTVHLFYGIVFN